MIKIEIRLTIFLEHDWWNIPELASLPKWNDAQDVIGNTQSY